MSPCQSFSNKQVFLVMIVRDSVRGKSYDLNDLDDDCDVRISYMNPWGDRSSLKCKVSKVRYHLSNLEERGCNIGSIFLA